MIGFKITPITPTGQKALQQCVNEEKAELAKKDYKTRAIFNAFTERKFILENEKWCYYFKLKDKLPLVMNAFIKPNQFKKTFTNELPNAVAEITASMQSNGALIEQDYFIEVFKDE